MPTQKNSKSRKSKKKKEEFPETKAPTVAGYHARTPIKFSSINGPRLVPNTSKRFRRLLKGLKPAHREAMCQQRADKVAESQQNRQQFLHQRTSRDVNFQQSFYGASAGRESFIAAANGDEGHSNGRWWES